MPSLFEITDKSGRIISLSRERWLHITKEHPRISDLDELRNTLVQPIKINPSKYDPDVVRYYYSYNKNIKRYLLVAVKYLNGHGFIITAYYLRKIQND